MAIPARRSQGRYTVVDIETTGDLPWKHQLVAVGIGNKVHKPAAGRTAVRKLLSDPESVVVCQSNYDLRWLLLDGAAMAEGVQFHDTKVMAFMLDQSQELGLDPLAQRYLGLPKLNKPIHQVARRVMFRSEILGKSVPIEDVPWPEMEEYNRQDLVVTADLYEHLRGLLQNSGQWDEMFMKEEMPFSKLLVEMEQVGMPLDAVACQELLERMSIDRDQLGVDLVKKTGMPEFKLGSGDMVASYLYDEMPTFKVQVAVPGLKGLPKEQREEIVRQMVPMMQVDKIGDVYAYGHKTIRGRGLNPPKMRMKKGKMPSRPPIDAENLALRYGGDPWVSKYLTWKSMNTLVSNYLEVWVDAEHDGRLHGRFDQARAETGRVASRDPNLQAIPVSMDWNVRTLFAAPLMIGDYSGLDVRVAAHFCEDPLMLEIFRNDMDLYGVLASDAWGGPADKSNPNRNLMKILMLSAQYGAHSGSIGDKIRISGLGDKYAKQAPKLLKDLEESLPRLFEWREEVLQEAKALGYITTISGRRRFLPDLYSDVWWKKTKAERQCVASKVQGTSADIVRRCMLACREQVPLEAARMVLQVHDEILWQRGPDWTDDTFDLLVHLSETAHNFDLNVPMKFDAGIGDSWDDKDAQGARSYRVLSGERN